MKIRTQLLLACFFLSVLPLTGIVLYSYRASKRALESAYHREASRLTTQMDRRLTNIRSDLDQRLAGLSAIPLSALRPGTKAGSDASHSGMVDNILMAMGEAAPLVDALEFVPVAAPPATPAVAVPATSQPAAPARPAPPVASSRGPAPRAVAAAPAPPAVRGSGRPAAPQVAEENDPDDEDAVNGNVEVAVDDEHVIDEPIVIDLPPVRYPKFVLPPDFNRRVSEITNLSILLSKQNLPAEEREALKETMKEKQELLKNDMEASRETFHGQMEEANERRKERERVIQERREAALEQRAAQQERLRRAEQERRERLQAVAAAPKASPAPAPKPVSRIVRVRSLTAEQQEQLKWKEKQAGLLFGQKFNVPLHSQGEVVGQIRAQVRTDEVIKRVLGGPNEDSAEIPFAVDREGTVYTRNNSGDRPTLERLGIIDAFKNSKPVPNLPNWIVAVTQHKESGLRVGVARPVGENLEDLRKTAATNFGIGVGVIALALIGFLPVAGHFTRDVRIVTEGAERIAQGDLMTRLPVRSKSEFGQLALAFNQMAEDLSVQQQKLLAQERAQREQDIQQRILARENERKSIELEEARRFQLSMLPKHVPQHARYEVAVMTQTAAEVGGDYYDFHLDGDVLSVTIGDATGHGAKAGTMVTVVKTLFAGYNASTEPSHFLSSATEKIKRMDLGRMAMALTLARFDGSRATVASAAMPPMLIHRAADGTIDEISLGATPLGTFGVDYRQTEVTIRSGDTILLMSDGFPELQNSEGQQLGYAAATAEFAAAAGEPHADAVIGALAASAKRWHGEQPPNDDITFVVVRCRA